MAVELLMAGLSALRDYIATHVLTCLVPAFFLAGGMVTFINRDAILQHLGEQAKKTKSFTLAGVSSFFLAACSCTVIPVASGLFYSGAGIGVAFIILWVAPAANILALTYTGTILGAEMVTARIVAALSMAFVVGIAMTVAFRSKAPDGEQETETAGTADSQQVSRFIEGRVVILLLLVLLSLLLPNYLVREGPYLHKVALWTALTLIAAGYAVMTVSREAIAEWLRETLWFVRIIFPLLLTGVFLVGVIGKVLPEAWITEWLGGSGITASFLATLIGAVSYFATMTEAPFVHTMMSLGMGRGPALALLLTGPGLSLPNWLAIARVFGVAKALVYVPVVIVLGTIVGWFFGTFIFV